jgi:hypothetical protein
MELRASIQAAQRVRFPPDSRHEAAPEWAIENPSSLDARSDPRGSFSQVTYWRKGAASDQAAQIAPAVHDADDFHAVFKRPK